MKPFLLENKYRVIPAFELNGVYYYQFDSAFEIPAGRALTSLTIYEEFNQRCTKEYLQKHCKAVEIILSDPKKINLNALALINYNLKERLDMVQLPEHVYKLASVMFFDKTESPYSYDFNYNQKKIKAWTEADGTLDFFLKTPFKELLPSLMLQQKSAGTFFNVAEKVDALHQKDLQAVLSSSQ
ncbi:MAG: hypothetical protein H0X33_14185 [Taibaiella sp.]|nr:hypothetical protein [Taibaiella sp.]